MNLLPSSDVEDAAAPLAPALPGEVRQAGWWRGFRAGPETVTSPSAWRSSLAHAFFFYTCVKHVGDLLGAVLPAAASAPAALVTSEEAVADSQWGAAGSARPAPLPALAGMRRGRPPPVDRGSQSPRSSLMLVLSASSPAALQAAAAEGARLCEQVPLASETRRLLPCALALSP